MASRADLSMAMSKEALGKFMARTSVVSRVMGGPRDEWRVDMLEMQIGEKSTMV